MRILLVTSMALAGVVAAAIGPAAAATPTPSAPMALRLEAATHVGYRFDAGGAITAQKSATLTRPARVSTTARKYIAGRGVHLLVANGTWAGYWLRESMIAYIPGWTGEKPISPIASVTLPPGNYIGYTFASNGVLTSSMWARVPSTATVTASNYATINGQPYFRVTTGTFGNRWLPGSITSPRRVTCAVPAKLTTTTRQTLYRIPNAPGQVALTFDMGGRVDPALSIMDFLIEHRICTTLFPTGAMSQTSIGQQVLARIRAHPELFELASHTMHHCNLRDGGGGSPSSAPCPTTKPTYAFIQKEMTDAAAILKAATGRDPLPYWRPPYGAIDAGVIDAVGDIGYTKTFMWDVDTIDWRPVADGGPTAYGIANKVRLNAVGGSDVLMHLGGYNTRDALPYMVLGLRARGLAPTSLSDMLR
jgi:peptidoglycan/xylan/chitin deacetylase (PgdA/CDA1 family)